MITKESNQRKLWPWLGIGLSILLSIVIAISPIASVLTPTLLFLFCAAPSLIASYYLFQLSKNYWIKNTKSIESKIEDGEIVVGNPPQRDAIAIATRSAALADKSMHESMLLGFNLYSGSPIWLNDERISKHICIIEPSSSQRSGITEAIMLQQLLRARASGFAVFDNDSDSKQLERLELLLSQSGRRDDLLIIDPLSEKSNFNPCLAKISSDNKANRILTLLPEQNLKPDEVQIATDLLYRFIRTLDSNFEEWTLSDLISLLESKDHELFKQSLSKNIIESLQYKEVLELLNKELKKVYATKIGKNIFSASEYIEIANAISQGKIIYFKVPKAQPDHSELIWKKIYFDDFLSTLKTLSSKKLDDPFLIFFEIANIQNDLSLFFINELSSNKNFGLCYRIKTNLKANDSKENLALKELLIRVGTKLYNGFNTDQNYEFLKNWVKDVLLSSGQKVSKQLPLTFETESEQVFDDEERSTESLQLEEEPPALSKLTWIDFGNNQLIQARYLAAKFN